MVFLSQDWRILDFFSHHPESLHMVRCTTCICAPLLSPPSSLCKHNTVGYLFDALSLSLQFTFLWDDVGIPQDYRHMEGFGVHTYKLVNKSSKETYVKFHWKPTCGKLP